jgi:TonB family protein
MSSPALRAAGALLFLSTLPALAAVAPAAPAARPVPVPPAIMATSAAIKEITAGQATLPYLQWLDTLPGFRFSPATSRLLVKQFGTDRLFSVTRSLLPTGGRNYVLTVPTLRRSAFDGSSVGWSAMQGQMAVQPDGHTVVSTFSAPRIVAEDQTLRMEASGMAYASTTRLNGAGLSFGTGIAELDSLELTGKAGAPSVRIDGAFFKFGVTDQGATVDMVNDMGMRTLTVQGERIDDVHMNLRFTGLDKTALEHVEQLGKELSAKQTAAVTKAQRDAIMGPIALQLGAAVMAPGAAIELDDIGFSYRGSTARLHGQLHLENAVPADLNAMASLVRKVAGHLDVQVPLAMLHAFTENMARTQLAKQQPGADAAAVARLGMTLYDGLLRTATASGYVRVDGDMLVTSIDIHDGVILLNGKPLQFPKAPPPVAAVTGAGGLMRARRIADKCTLPDFPPDVVANDSALSLAMRLTVNADGTVSKLMLARSSGWPGYDKAVLAAASQCTYIPALLAGKPVAVPATWDVVREPGSLRP